MFDRIWKAPPPDGTDSGDFSAALCDIPPEESPEAWEYMRRDARHDPGRVFYIAPSENLLLFHILEPLDPTFSNNRWHSKSNPVYAHNRKLEKQASLRPPIEWASCPLAAAISLWCEVRELHRLLVEAMRIPPGMLSAPGTASEKATEP